MKKSSALEKPQGAETMSAGCQPLSFLGPQGLSLSCSTTVLLTLAQVQQALRGDVWLLMFKTRRHCDQIIPRGCRHARHGTVSQRATSLCSHALFPHVLRSWETQTHRAAAKIEQRLQKCTLRWALSLCKTAPPYLQTTPLHLRGKMLTLVKTVHATTCQKPFDVSASIQTMGLGHIPEGETTLRRGKRTVR